MAMKAGHPCYFIGFLPDPVPGQTIEDISRAEATFLERVIALHPEAEGKPAVIGNCQAGWAVMMVAAMRPELFGPIIVAGSPLSYWAGVQRAEPHALHRGLAGWDLAHRSDGRPRKRQVRRRVARHEFREPQSVQYASGRSSTTFIPRSTARHRAISNSSNGGARMSCSMPRKCSSSPMSCLSAISLPQQRSCRRTAPASICATSAPRSSSSVRRRTISRRRHRRWSGFSTSTRVSMTYERTARRSSMRFTS